MPDETFRYTVEADVRGTEKLQAMAKQLVGIQTAAQQPVRAGLRGISEDFSKQISNLDRLAPLLNSFQRRVGKVFATGLVPKGTAANVRTETQGIVRALNELGRPG